MFWGEGHQEFDLSCSSRRLHQGAETEGRNECTEATLLYQIWFWNQTERKRMLELRVFTSKEFWNVLWVPASVILSPLPPPPCEEAEAG